MVPHSFPFVLSVERSILHRYSQKMAMILNAFVERYVGKLLEFGEGKISLMLGVKDDLQKLRRTMERIRGFLESAEHKRYTDPNVNTWVIELKDVMYDADDIIDRCMIEGRILLENHPSISAVRHPSPSSYFSPGFQIFKLDIGDKIKKLNDRLEEISKARSYLPELEYSARESGVNTRRTFPSMIESDIVGTKIVEATQRLVESLIKEDDEKYRISGIVGLGGIGKTTLASNIYNDEKIKKKFPKRVWVCISQDFSEIKLLKEMIRGVGGNYEGDETKAELVPRLSSFLSSERFFIVLDDVWKPDVWENLLRHPFESAKANGRIVITTRHTNVARSIGAEIHHVDKMDDDSCWKLLHKNVFGHDDDEEEEISGLKEIGMKIVEKCDGLPLAVKVIAGVLKLRDINTMEWSKVLESDAWSMSQLHEELPRALFLSYENLPSDLKQCFLYCSLFPEDYYICREDLIRYWVAEGFVKTTRGNTLMEDLAEDYYKELIWRNLLHEYEDEDEDEDDTFCTMHDLLRSLALFLIRDESIFLGDGQSPNTKVIDNPLSKLRRLSMVNAGEKVDVPDVIKQQKCLRTLLVWRSRETKMVKNELFESLKFLRVMNLSHTRLESLPDFVGDLVHLRYLNVDGTTIKELPESIGRLVNLEMLHLSRCEGLSILPNAITKLCNLRCLCLEGTPLSYVPKGMGKLKNLNHLEGFVGGTQDGCDLEDLQSLSQLRFLSIRKLERAKPGGASVLANSHSLRTLILNCEDEEDQEDAIAIQRINEIFSELSPQSTHLQRLEIRRFFGTGFPSWMMSTSLDVSFPNLTEIRLYLCKSCRQLPPLGMLPQLKLLRIEGARAIKTIGPEFLGPRASSAATSFPKLEELNFDGMSNWEEWSFGMVEGVGEERREAPRLLPHLTKLNLHGCHKLRALPPLGMLPELKYLSIEHAGAIKTIGPEFLGLRASSAATSFPKLEVLSFSFMSNWKEWSFGMVEGVGEERREAPKLLPHLRQLTLYGCHKLRALPPLGLLPQLKYLRIDGAGAIKIIGPEFLGPRASSAATSFPKVEELSFSSMSNWEEWSFGMVEGVGEERGGASKLLPRLRKLYLCNCPKLRALPRGLQHVTNLQQLIITEAGDLIEINNLPSLKSLEINGCSRLEHVENLDKLQFLKFTDLDRRTERLALPRWLLELLENAPAALPSLKEFHMECSLPFLKTFFKDGPNWPIIQRIGIPKVRIQEHWLTGSSYVQYTKEPPTFETHIDESEESLD